MRREHPGTYHTLARRDPPSRARRERKGGVRKPPRGSAPTPAVRRGAPRCRWRICGREPLREEPGRPALRAAPAARHPEGGGPCGGRRAEAPPSAKWTTASRGTHAR
eukprot:scaffold71237_cov30-Tisochrysis_lutea.AAC.1